MDYKKRYATDPGPRYWEVAADIGFDLLPSEGVPER
jgi:hypothetical protein